MSSDDSTNAMGSRRRDAQVPLPVPGLFMPHPGFSDEVNRNITQSEIEGGVCLDALSEGAVLEVETQHHWYTIVNRSGGEALISGHPTTPPNLCR
jgi:(2Fe-2S) ferredoxin